MINFRSNQKGFTLIELLVVISIIGVLSTVVLASLSTARAKARDAKRLSDLTQLRTALELYASDNGGKYPLNLLVNQGVAYDVERRFVGTGPTSCAFFNTSTISKGLDTLVTQKYISKIPQDPRATNTTCYVYAAQPNDFDNISDAYGVAYKLRVFGTMEALDAIATDHTFRDPVSNQATCPTNYSSATALKYTVAVYSPGGECF